ARRLTTPSDRLPRPTPIRTRRTTRPCKRPSPAGASSPRAGCDRPGGRGPWCELWGPEVTEASTSVPATDGAQEQKDTAALIGSRYLMRFQEDTLRERPLWIRLIIEYEGTLILATVAAGAGVINHYAGGGPISRTAAVIAPGAVVMAMIYALGPLSGLHINPAVTFAFASRRVFPRSWVVPYWVAQFAGAVVAALF